MPQEQPVDWQAVDQAEAQRVFDLYDQAVLSGKVISFIEAAELGDDIPVGTIVAGSLTEFVKTFGEPS